MENESMQKSPIAGTIFRVAWLSILLGVGMEVILLGIAAGFGKLPGVKAVIADLVQKISWSTIVCAGLALGTLVSKLRAPVMGLAGLLAAPIAFNVARALHKTATQVLTVTGPAAAGPSPFLLASIKAAQYAVFGYVLGLLSRKGSANILSYVLTGVFMGLTFGGLIVFLSVQQSQTPVPLIGLISRSANELIFPIGCALVLYAAQHLSLAGAKETQTP